MRTTNTKLVKAYADAYLAALKQTRDGRGQKGKAATKVARQFRVTKQHVRDVLVDARKLGYLDGGRQPAGKTKTPEYTSKPQLRATLTDVFEGLCGTAYMAA